MHQRAFSLVEPSTQRACAVPAQARIHQRGFSLVELSIVLVILGLLTGGILAGQSLIRAAELRSVTSEYQRYVASVQSFRDKYMALPGDINNATRFWGRQNSNADCVTNSSAAVSTSGSCDGNGNGVLDNAAAVSQSSEAFQGWRQLALAGLVEGSYSGYTSALGTWHVSTDNSPSSKLNTALWGYGMAQPLTGHTDIFDRTEVNQLQFQVGAMNSAGGGNRVTVFRPEELWNIDVKMDDGKPARGKVRARGDTDNYTFPHYSTATNSSQLDADYLLTQTSKTCTGILYF